MNYRHHYHAGNFADVVKHALLLQLVKGLQRKEKGFLYLDTHAGRGRYDLSTAAQGDSLERKPEWPEGVGRLWKHSALASPLADYVALVRSCDLGHGNPAEAAEPRYYPGSPWLVQALARPQDRLALCEKQPEEFAILDHELSIAQNAKTHPLDGYTALRAMLPPPEKRALVLIDPPYEEQSEFTQIVEGLRGALKRLPGATYAIWYPLTERARIDSFAEALLSLQLPPTWVVELSVAGEAQGLKMRGCGLVVLNPPWTLDREIQTFLPQLRTLLAQGPGSEATLRWLVPEDA